MWSDDLITYYAGLKAPDIPEQYACMNPYTEPDTMLVVEAFLKKYFNDSDQRTLLFGINPGRFGSGVTGISFTDPIRLKESLGISHAFDMRPELSSQFIYEVIEAFGDARAFYRSFFISAVYPLGFLQDGKNINYYELKDWKTYMLDHIVSEMQAHMQWNINRDACLCIGKGENYKVLNALNQNYKWFDEVVALPHPRWVLQYRRREKEQHVDAYLAALDRYRPG